MDQISEYVLQCFERKILRRMYGPICENGIWRKHNQKLYALFKDVEISKHIKLTRFRWACHVIRKEDQEISKNILLAQTLGRREEGQLCAGGME